MTSSTNYASARAATVRAADDLVAGKVTVPAGVVVPADAASRVAAAWSAVGVN